MIKRKLYSTLKKELNKREITAVLGSRQVGKTTLLEQLHKELESENKKTVYISFDNKQDLDLFEKNEELFKSRFVDVYDFIFIDEIQYSKESGRILKYLFDSTGKKFIISGSSLPELSIKTLSYLVGRVRYYMLYTLGFDEFLEFKDKREELVLFDRHTSIETFSRIKNDFEEYLLFGGYPQVVLEKDEEEKEKLLQYLVNMYLLKEIREILGFSDSSFFQKVLEYLAINDSGILNKSSMSQDLGISRVKIVEILLILEKTCIIYQLKPYLKNKTNELIKSSKSYFLDIGFKNSLLENFAPIRKKNTGSIYEYFVLKTLIEANFTVKFWNYKNRFEMDFIVEKNGKVVGIECKSSIKEKELTNSTKKCISMTHLDKVYVLNTKYEGKGECEGVSIEWSSYENFYGVVRRKKLHLI